MAGCNDNKIEGSFSENHINCYIPDEIIFSNEVYSKIEDDELDSHSFKKFVGFLINTEDLEKWEAIDNDENIIYATSQEKVQYRVYHKTVRHGLFYKEEFDEYELCGAKQYKEIKDRFKLFVDENQDGYLLADNGDAQKIFKIVEEKAYNEKANIEFNHNYHNSFMF